MARALVRSLALKTQVPVERPGITVNDVAVVGSDDVPFAQYLSPPLTTVRAPIEEVGREAVHQLTRLMNGQPAQALTLMRTELVIRESCGCRFSSSNKTQDHSSISQGGETRDI